MKPNRKIGPFCKASGLTLMLMVGFVLGLKAQFYNGHQMTFGKSRVQYNDFYWQYYRFPKFDTYFYVGGSKLAEYVSEVAMQELELVEYSLEEVLQRRMIFIVYNKLSEFRQSNIGLVSGNDDSNIGGVTKIIDNKVFVYYEGDHVQLKRQIRASITEILMNEMLYGGSFRNRVSSSAMLNLPEWYGPGLISFMAYDTDVKTEALIKKGMLTEKYQKIHRLHGDDAKLAGHAFWRYLSETYGQNIISNIVYMTQVTKSVESGFLYVLGSPLKEVLSDWYYYYEGRYKDEITARPEKVTDANPYLKKANKKRIYTQARMSPNGNYIAYTGNQDGKYKVWLYNVQTDKKKLLFSKGQKLEQITDYSYPLLAWHPMGNVLSTIYEHKGKIWLDICDVENDEHQLREVFFLDKVLDFSYSADGSELVISAVEDGYTDIFTYSILASTFHRVTNDVADDLSPRFTSDGKSIIFSSNRKTIQLKYKKDEKPEIQTNFDLFLYKVNDAGNELFRITDSYFDNESSPIEYKKDRYFFLTDQNGIVNRGLVLIDSVISIIDTSIHYRPSSKQYPISNNPFNLNYSDYNPLRREFTGIYAGVKRPHLITEAVNPALRPTKEEYQNTWFKNYIIEKNITDSLFRLEVERSYEPDTTQPDFLTSFSDSLIDINNYVFEVEKRGFYFDDPGEMDGNRVFRLPKQMVYFTNFYSNLLVTQVDFGFMSESYQAFTGSAFYFNPGFNILTKVGAIDLFEDYKITGGIRFSIDFESNEYLLSVENLKYRLDKQYIYHRQVFESATNDYYSKIFTNEFMARYKYPFTQVHAVRGTFSLRLDEQVYKAYDQNTLAKPDDYKFWAGFKGEYIYDDTRKLGLNLYEGTRMKLFGEYYTQIGQGANQHLFVFGADARNYLRIHRDLVFASRFATGTSFGNALLIYYLGGVDNWMNLSQNTPTFDYATPINQDKNWVYQAVATNMRGFIQNVRNGNTFAVANFELRWPVVRYLFNRPISNDFFNNFMAVGFADVGSAWMGLNPMTAVNAYDYQPIPNGPITVIIDRKHSPLVYGVGFGLRSRLLGYYVRTDWAWGIDGGRMLPRVFYLSLCTDF